MHGRGCHSGASICKITVFDRQKGRHGGRCASTVLPIPTDDCMGAAEAVSPANNSVQPLFIAVPGSQCGRFWFGERQSGQIIIGWPGLSQEINDKRALALHIQELQTRFGTENFDFHPRRTFSQPAMESRSRGAVQAGQVRGPFIFKPASQGQGKGITVVRDITNRSKTRSFDGSCRQQRRRW